MGDFFAPFVVDPGTPAQPGNAYVDYDNINSNTSRSSVTAGGSNNVLGTYATVFTASANLRAIEIQFGSGSGTNNRYQISIKVNGVVRIPDYFVCTSNSRSVPPIIFPIKVNSGDAIEIAARCSAGGGTMAYSVKGHKARSDMPAGYDIMEMLAVSGAPNLLGTGSTIPGANAANNLANDGLYKSLGQLTQSYGALMFAFGHNAGTAPASSQPWHIHVGVSDISSTDPNDYTVIRDLWVDVSTTTPYLTCQNPPIIPHSVLSGKYVGLRALVGTPNSDLISCAPWGFR